MDIHVWEMVPVAAMGVACIIIIGGFGYAQLNKFEGLRF
jgi:hypothetical protein